MSSFEPSTVSEGQTGAGLTSALRGWLVGGVLFLDSNGKLTALTRDAEQMLGLEAARMQGASYEQLPEPLRQLAADVLSSGQAVPECLLELKRPGHQALTLCARAVPLQAEGRSAGLALLLTNLSPARQLEAHIEQLDRLASLGTLAASMAHEIKNALVAGKTFIDLLLEKHKDVELADVVGREIRRIDSIVIGMLKFAGPARTALSPVSLHEALEHSLRLVQHQFDTHSIIVSRSFDAAPDFVQAEEHGLEQAFVNLFLNALETMGPGGTLTVTTEALSAPPQEAPPAASAPARQLRVKIQDTGPGIPAENLERIFEPFFTTKPTGTGLGLAITRRIVQDHGGAIAVQSQPNQGATFIITLPAVQG